MNQELLLEAIEIIGKHLLYDPKFGGNPEARRLSEVLYQLTGNSRSRSLAPSTTQRTELMTRTLTLPIDLDNKLTVAAEKTGIDRDKLIADALAAVIAENRLI